MIGKELTEENGNKMPMGNQSANAGMAFNGSGAESGLSNQAANGETAINNNNLGSSMQKIPDKSMRDTANTLSTLDNWALLRKYQDGVTDGNINAQNHTDLSGIDRKWLQNQATGQKSILEIMDEARKQQNAPADFQRWKPYWAMCSEDRSVANFKDASGKISTKYFYDANGQPCRKFTDTTNGKSLLVSKSNPVAPNPTQPQNNGTIEQQAKTQEPKNAEKVNLDFDTDTWDRVTNQRVTGLHPKVQTATRGFINEVEKTLGIRLRVSDAYRSIAEQDSLYAIGRTKPGDKVTWVEGGNSYHNYGLAIDVVGIRGGKVDYSILEKVAPIGKKWGFEWGGDWAQPKTDRPHFQMPLGRSIAELKDSVKQAERK